MTPKPELSIIIPTFNQGSYLEGTFNALRQEFSDIQIEIVVVNDGSTQDMELVKKNSAEKLISFEQNQGKGAAVKAGVLASEGKIVLYTDADLSYSTEFLRKLYQAVDTEGDGEVDAALGVRESLLEDGFVRGLSSRIVRSLVKRWILKREADTQCGAKAFSEKVAKEVFEKVRVKRFAFDVEVFWILEKMKARVAEFPTSFEARAGSSVRLVKDGLTFIRDLRHIKRNVKKGLYD